MRWSGLRPAPIALAPRTRNSVYRFPAFHRHRTIPRKLSPAVEPLRRFGARLVAVATSHVHTCDMDVACNSRHPRVVANSRVVLSNPHGQRGILLRTTPAGPGSRRVSRPLGRPCRVILVALALFVFYFFRDPERAITTEPGAVVSPADGRIVVITDEANNGKPGKRVSIFLAIWNVHVNRSPEAGTITGMDYRPGKFLAAMVARASAENEQNVISLSTAAGEMMFKQIAGLIARRVVCWKKPGDVVARGERIGLVRFGSRVDLWVPRDAEILVKLGDNVKGGSQRARALAGSHWLETRASSRRSGAAIDNLTATGNLK